MEDSLKTDLKQLERYAQYLEFFLGYLELLRIIELLKLQLNKNKIFLQMQQLKRIEVVSLIVP